MLLEMGCLEFDIKYWTQSLSSRVSLERIPPLCEEPKEFTSPRCPVNTSIFCTNGTYGRLKTVVFLHRNGKSQLLIALVTSCEGVEGFRYTYDAHFGHLEENRHCVILLGSVLWEIKHGKVSILVCVHIGAAPAWRLLIQQKPVCVLVRWNSRGGCVVQAGIRCVRFLNVDGALTKRAVPRLSPQRGSGSWLVSQCPLMSERLPDLAAVRQHERAGFICIDWCNGSVFKWRSSQKVIDLIWLYLHSHFQPNIN